MICYIALENGPCSLTEMMNITHETWCFLSSLRYRQVGTTKGVHLQQWRHMQIGYNQQYDMGVFANQSVYPEIRSLMGRTI